jgi:hypothetical protein
LQHIQVANLIVHLQDCCFRGQVIVAPQTGSQDSINAINVDGLHLVSSGTFHWGDVETQDVAMLASAFDVDLG